MSRSLRISKKDAALYARLSKEQREKVFQETCEEIERVEQMPVAPRQNVIRAEIEEMKNLRRQIADNDKKQAATARWMVMYEEFWVWADRYNEFFFSRTDEERWCEEFRVILGNMISLRDRLIDLLPQTAAGKKEKKLFWKEHERLPWPSMLESYKLLTTDLNAQKRADRINANPRYEFEQEKVLCARCQKKVARLEGFCKKCARLEGIVVHGKIT